MRTREQIKQEWYDNLVKKPEDAGLMTGISYLQLEVLLDIRDLLTPPKSFVTRITQEAVEELNHPHA